MYKLLTPKDLLKVLERKIESDDVVSDKIEFLEELAGLVTEYAGGEVGTISHEEGATDPFWIVIHKDERMAPGDGFYHGLDDSNWREDNAKNTYNVRLVCSTEIVVEADDTEEAAQMARAELPSFVKPYDQRVTELKPEEIDRHKRHAGKVLPS
jgi:hypothetical protein